MNYEHIITQAARRFMKRCPEAALFLTEEDAKHEAFLLLERVQNEFDPVKGGSNFPKFAIQRLEWRLVDLVRSQSWAPRSVPASERKLQFFVSPVKDSDSETCMTDLDNAIITDHPAKEFIEEDAVRGLADLLKSIIPADYRDAFELYYVQGLTMREAGDKLGVTESRVSQRLAKARELIYARYPGGQGLLAI